MMERLAAELKALKIDQAIDLATRRGDFAANLVQGLGSFNKIYGIDIDEKALAKGREALPPETGVIFEYGDAYATDYPSGHFDLVALGNSLHHFEDIPALLREAQRILAPQGILLISEMTADGQDDASLTHALLHGWESQMDRAQGLYHGSTFTQGEIVAMLEEAGFTIRTSFLDWDKEPKLVKGIEKRLAEIDDKLKAFETTEIYEELKATAVAIKENYQSKGAAFAAAFVVFAEKNTGGQ